MGELKTAFLIVSIVVVSWAVPAYFYGIKGLLISIGVTLLVMGSYLIWVGVTNNLPT